VIQRPAALAGKIRATSDVDREVADAMIATPRHRFVRWRYLLGAYGDWSLPTGKGTTISQPTYIAKVISAGRVAAGDDVLEIGTGSGWTAAIIARLAHEIVTVDCVPALVQRARKRLAGVPNVRVVLGDGVHAVTGTFDVIFVMAGGTCVPSAYTDRLREGGRLVMPVGKLRDKSGMHGVVTRVTRRNDQLVQEDLFPGDWNLLTGRDQ